MGSITNYPNGVNNSAQTTDTGFMPIQDDSRVHSYFDDFDTFATGDWTTTLVGAGGTQALTALAGGCLLTTTDAGATDSVSTQLTTATFQLVAGKQAWFKIRLKISNATTSVLQVGLQATDTTPFTYTDGVVFTKAAASTSVLLKATASSTTTTSSSVATLADDTFIVLAWYYNGVDSISAFSNGVYQTKIVSTNLPSALQNVSFALKNGSAVSRNFTIDYVLAAVER